MLGNQISNQLKPTLTAEFGRTFPLGDTIRLRPFAEFSAGAEDFARLGGDILIGGSVSGGLMVRDVTTGQRYSTTDVDGTGFSFSFGGDVAKVFSSTYLPSDEGYALTDERLRLRAGLSWQGEQQRDLLRPHLAGPRIRRPARGPGRRLAASRAEVLRPEESRGRVRHAVASCSPGPGRRSPGRARPFPRAGASVTVSRGLPEHGAAP